MKINLEFNIEPEEVKKLVTVDSKTTEEWMFNGLEFYKQWMKAIYHINKETSKNVTEKQ